MFYFLFNIMVGVQQYSIFYEEKLFYHYPFDLNITGTIVFLSLIFLIAHILITIKPIRDK